MTGMGDIPRELVALFEPQVEQLGVRLERRGGIWVGETRGSVATGSMWLCAPMPYCLVLCHDVTPLEDMPLFEGSLGPYACACTMGDDAVSCSRDCGLPIRFVGAGGGARRPHDEVASAAPARSQVVCSPATSTAPAPSSVCPTSSTSWTVAIRGSSVGSSRRLTAPGAPRPRGRFAMRSPTYPRVLRSAPVGRSGFSRPSPPSWRLWRQTGGTPAKTIARW